MGGENARRARIHGRADIKEHDIATALQPLPIDAALAQLGLKHEHRIVPHPFTRVRRLAIIGYHIRRTAPRDRAYCFHARRIVLHELHTLFVYLLI